MGSNLPAPANILSCGQCSGNSSGCRARPSMVHIVSIPWKPAGVVQVLT